MAVLLILGLKLVGAAGNAVNIGFLPQAVQVSAVFGGSLNCLGEDRGDDTAALALLLQVVSILDNPIITGGSQGCLVGLQVSGLVAVVLDLLNEAPVVLVIIVAQLVVTGVVGVVNIDAVHDVIGLALFAVLEVLQVIGLAHPVKEHICGGALLSGGVGVDAHNHAVAGILIIVCGEAVGNRAGSGRTHNGYFGVGVVGQQAAEHVGAAGHIEAVRSALTGDKLALGQRVIGGQVKLRINDACVVLLVHILQVILGGGPSKRCNVQIQVLGQLVIAGALGDPVVEVGEALGDQRGVLNTKTRVLEGLHGGLEFLVGGGHIQPDLIQPVLTNQRDPVVVDGVALCEDESIFTVQLAVGLDGVLHVIPIGRGIVGNFIQIDGLLSTFGPVVDSSRHIIMEDNGGGVAGGNHLVKVLHLIGAGDGNVFDGNVILIAELGLDPAGVVVVCGVPVFKAAVINRDLDGDILREARRIISVAARALRSGSSRSRGSGAFGCRSSGRGSSRARGPAASGEQGCGHGSSHTKCKCLFHCFPPF